MLKLIVQQQTLYLNLTSTVGDWDCNSRAEKTVENIQARNPELVLGLGDYVYGEDSVDCWFEIV